MISYEPPPNQYWRKLRVAGSDTHARPQGGVGTLFWMSFMGVVIGWAVFVAGVTFLMIVAVIPVPKDVPTIITLRNAAYDYGTRGALTGLCAAVALWFYKGNWFREGKRIVGDASPDDVTRRRR